MKVVVPVTSLCPCSKGISDYGAHNQRSHVTVTARTRGFVWIEDLVRICEEQASCELYGLLKRPDEKYVTERAYDNPKFVEDMVRDIAAVLNRDDRIESLRGRIRKLRVDPQPLGVRVHRARQDARGWSTERRQEAIHRINRILRINRIHILWNGAGTRVGACATLRRA